MMPEPNGTPEQGGTRKAKRVGLAGLLIILGSVITAWAVGWGYLPYFAPPATILGLGVIIGMILICCTSSLFTMSVAMKIPEYGELEIVFEEGLDFYSNEEWKEALQVFRKVMGSEMNHKRALFYAAKCSEKLDDYEGVKMYLSYYMKMQSKDREAWEMLANAHKKLFEYSEADVAMQRAQQLE
ncbi:MAG: tetratricopeptide repeat protein [Candidatus Thorarchaeota archaeon]